MVCFKYKFWLFFDIREVYCWRIFDTSGGMGLASMPSEFLPEPAQTEIVDGVDGGPDGAPVVEGRVFFFIGAASGSMDVACWSFPEWKHVRRAAPGVAVRIQPRGRTERHGSVAEMTEAFMCHARALFADILQLEQPQALPLPYALVQFRKRG